MNERLFAEALLAGTHSFKTLQAEFGLSHDEDQAIDLSSITLEDRATYLSKKVLPTSGIARYLACGDLLTNEAINAMETAMEKEFKVEEPYFITSMRSGREGKDLKVDYFYLEIEP